MANESQNQNQGQSQSPVQSSPPLKPQSNLPKVDPSKTISYRQDGADHKLDGDLIVIAEN